MNHQIIRCYLERVTPDWLDTIDQRFEAAAHDAEGEQSGLLKLAIEVGVQWPFPKNKCQLCGIQTSLFAFKGQKASRCAKHKEPGMVDVIRKKCQHSRCKKIPIFGVPGGKISHCASHKKLEMVYLYRNMPNFSR
jgi:hypothetical protein